jgi:hypothetical protein
MVSVSHIQKALPASDLGSMWFRIVPLHIYPWLRLNIEGRFLLLSWERRGFNTVNMID